MNYYFFIDLSFSFSEQDGEDRPLYVHSGETLIPVKWRQYPAQRKMEYYFFLYKKWNSFFLFVKEYYFPDVVK